MNEVKRHVVTAEEAGMRLDRWFRVHFPQVTFAYLNKLTRTGQVISFEELEPDLKLVN